MLKTNTRPPRAEGDQRMYLYYDPAETRRHRWYVKVSRKGRKKFIKQEYGSAEFDSAYEAAVVELGGVVRMRRTKSDEKPVQPTRRFVICDVSDKGQLRYYVQLRTGLPKIRLYEEFGTAEFEREADRAIASQIALHGQPADEVELEKQTREKRIELPTTPPKPGTLRFFWEHYKQSDAWLGNATFGEKGLKPNTRQQRVLLLEPLLYVNGEKPFKVLTRKFIRKEMEENHTIVQAGNLLSALRHFIRWMIAEEHLDEDDDPTINIKSGKSAFSKKSGGFVPWEEENMTAYRKRWPLGTEARLMFDILHFTYLRRGDASRFGQAHVRKQKLAITTEKSDHATTVEMLIHPDLFVSLRAARAAGLFGEELGEVFTGKRVGFRWVDGRMVGGRVEPMSKQSWAAKFKKYAIMAGVNEPKKNCHGVRKARAEDAAYAGMTESQMMACFGWLDEKMPAHYIAKANRSKLGDAGQQKMIAYDQNQNIDDFLAPVEENARVTFLGNRRKKS